MGIYITFVSILYIRMLIRVRTYISMHVYNYFSYSKQKSIAPVRAWIKYIRTRYWTRMKNMYENMR